MTLFVPNHAVSFFEGTAGCIPICRAHDDDLVFVGICNRNVSVRQQGCGMGSAGHEIFPPRNASVGKPDQGDSIPGA